MKAVPVFSADQYKRTLEENGYQDLQDEVKPIDFSLGKLKPEDLALYWLCHYGCREFADIASTTRERVKVISGIGLSGVPHLGTLAQMLKAIRLQSEGNLAVQFFLGDLDAHAGKGTPLDQTRLLAEKTRRFMEKIGFDNSGRSELTEQYNDLGTLRTMYLASYFMEDVEFDEAEEDLHSFYAQKGKVEDVMTFRRKLSLALMVGGWYHQQLEKGEKNILIMLGLDEHKYVKFGQKVLSRMQQHDLYEDRLDGATIAAMYSRLIKGFNDYPKMSKSFPDSGITLDMSKAYITKLIMDGEGKKREELPEDNVIIQCICHASTFTNQEIYEAIEAYQKGGTAWIRIKKKYISNLWELIKKWETTRVRSL